MKINVSLFLIGILLLLSPIKSNEKQNPEGTCPSSDKTCSQKANAEVNTNANANTNTNTNAKESANANSNTNTNEKANKDASSEAQRIKDSKPKAQESNDLEIEDVPEEEKEKKEKPAQKKPEGKKPEGKRKLVFKHQKSGKNRTNEAEREDIQYPEDFQYQKLFQKYGDKTKYLKSLALEDINT